MIDLTTDEIRLESLLERWREPSHGAQLIFTGRVRNRNHGRKVVAVSYDAFAPLTRATFEEICAEARERFGGRLGIDLIHRIGTLRVGEISVVIQVSSPHRDEGYRASRYLIEELKNRAPIWKKETYEDGESDWLQGHALCGLGAE